MTRYKSLVGEIEMGTSSLFLLETISDQHFIHGTVCPAGHMMCIGRKRRAYRPKRCENNNEDEDNSSNILNLKNHPASF